MGGSQEGFAIKSGFKASETAGGLDILFFRLQFPALLDS